MTPNGRVAVLLATALACAASAGCVRRTITITSEPSGALVYLNEREVGRTPVDVEFTYYGTYDVRLLLDGHEPLLTSGEAKPPLWDTIPFDFVAEIAPGVHESRIEWHYVLETRDDDPGRLVERASAMRAAVEALGPASDAEAGSEGGPDDDAGE